MPSKRLTIQQRRSVFEALVELQDQGNKSVPETVREISSQFGITEKQVRQIEEEGIDKEWPPLDEVPQAATS